MFLVGIGPLLPWRRASAEQLRRRVAGPGRGRRGAMLVLAVAGMRSVAATIALGLAAFVAVGNVQELARGVRAVGRATGARGFAAVRGRASAGTRACTAGWSSTSGLAVAVAAITVSAGFGHQTEVTLARGERATLEGYTLTYEGRREVQQPQRTVLIADVAVREGGEDLGRLTPSLNLYPLGLRADRHAVGPLRGPAGPVRVRHRLRPGREPGHAPLLPQPRRVVAVGGGLDHGPGGPAGHAPHPPPARAARGRAGALRPGPRRLRGSLPRPSRLPGDGPFLYWARSRGTLSA